MSKKWLLGIATIMVAIAVGGIGFASYTSSITVNGAASSGTLALAFDYGSGTGGTYAVCAITGLNGANAYITASDLSPGDHCSLTLGIINNGTLPATSETSVFGYVSGSYCNSPSATNCVSVSDNLAPISLSTTAGTSGSSSQTIAAGGGLFPGNYVVTISEPSGSTQSVSLSFTITFTGSVG
jgi:hypothetical protein